MQIHERLFIGGRWAAPSTSALLEVRSPTTDEVIGVLPKTAEADIDLAITAARGAFTDGPWRHLSFAERAGFLKGLSDSLRERGPELDQLVAAEAGIPVMFMSGSSGCSLLDYLADFGQSYDGVEVRSTATAHGIIRRAPMGVVAGITPWNGPVMQVLMKLAPALLAGNTVVIKAAEETPLSSLAVAEACLVAGIPEGVVSILSGGREVGEHLVDHPGIDQVSFTGSTRVGRQIAASCGARLRRFNLELGGKSPSILLDDADLDLALPTAVQFAMFFNGEACAALTRTLVPRARHDEIAERIAAIVGTFKMGDPLEADTFIGPLITRAQRDRVEGVITRAVASGARLLAGGLRPEGDGWFVRPTVFSGVDNTTELAQEEIFGPVMSIIPYDDVDDAVRLANTSQYGLAGAVFSADEDRAIEVARRIESGHVGVNTLGMDWALPFGGFKQSGIGRELGREGLDEFTQIQTIGMTPR